MTSAARFVLPLLCLLPAAAPVGTTLIVEVDNVRTARGHVHVDLCTQAVFLKETCTPSAEAPAVIGTTNVVIHNVPPGAYAAQVFLDENDNHRVDRALFGIPKEGVGFSRDARIGFGPPKWADAVFIVGTAAHQATALHLRYFLGPQGPGK